MQGITECGKTRFCAFNFTGCWYCIPSFTVEALISPAKGGPAETTGTSLKLVIMRSLGDVEEPHGSCLQQAVAHGCGQGYAACQPFAC